MASQWYWRHRGDLLGPVDTKVLEDAIRRHRLGDRDQIRLAGTDEWLSGAEIKAFFADGTSGGKATDVASQLIKNVSQRGHIGSSARRPRQPTMADRLTSTGRLLLSPFAWMLDRLADWTSPVMPFLTGKVVLAIATTILLVLVVANLDFAGNSPNQAVHKELDRAWQEVQIVRKQGPSDDEWRAFQESQLAWLSECRARLDAAASRRSGSWQELIPLGTPTFQSMEIANCHKALVQSVQAFESALNAGPTDDISATEEAFRVHMEYVQDIVIGGFSERMSAPRSPVGTGASLVSRSSIDPAVATFLVLDGILVIAGVTYWFRR